MNHILFIVASLRKGSFNRQLAAVAEEMIGGRAEVAYLDFCDVPLMNQDIENPVPGSVAWVRDEVQKADGIWIFTPEYNFSYPGLLKNLLDWLSRPADPSRFDNPSAVVGKRVTVSGAGGKNQTRSCREKLNDLLAVMKMQPMTEPQAGIALGVEAWTEGKFALTDEQRAAVQAQVETFLAFLEK